LYQLAQRECAATVEATAALPVLPQPVWSAAEPAAVALELGCAATLLELQRQQTRFVRWHEVGAALRRTGGLGPQQLPGGAPEP
jgi:hypothetical protein